MVKIDMPMPKNCRECKLIHYEEATEYGSWQSGYVCPFITGKIQEFFLHNERHSDCPLKADCSEQQSWLNGK